MSRCEACRKAFPDIPASLAAPCAIFSEHGSEHDSEHDSEHGHWTRARPYNGTWLWRDRLTLHRSWESLVMSLDHDCPICWTLWRNIRSSPIASPSNEIIKGFRAEIAAICYFIETAQYQIQISLTGHRLETKELGFYIWKTIEKCYLEAERTFPLAVQHTPRSAADAAKRWIKTCDEKHSQCLKLAAPPEHAKMPNRLLDVGDSDSHTWSLYQNPEHVPYAALSHRWSPETPELHTGNCKDYCHPQPDSALPQNYRDIISICRAIPIRYIWIDSLCIIQNDNGKEFSEEAPLMRDIYYYAFLTLSICWDFHGLSIFRRCQPRSIPRPRPRTCYGFDCGSKSDEFVFAQEMELGVHVTGAPINQRAWVLQERCLSRRLLYLGNDQLYWECDGCAGSEASPDGINKYGGRQSILDLTGDDRDRAWSLTLTQYTRNDLTFENDRLIAIAGLAKLIASKTRGTYLAGIWLESWMPELLWEPVQEIDRSSKFKPGEPTMKPPSWSWLGFSGSVRWPVYGPTILTRWPNVFTSLALLSEAVVIPPESDPFASFEQAILKIRCLLFPVRFSSTPDRDDRRWFFRHEYDVVELSSVGLDCFRLRACEQSEGGYVTCEFIFSKPVDMSLRYFLVPLYRRQRPWADSLPPCVYGLVLQKGLSDGNEIYTRVGMWWENSSESQLSPIVSNTIVNIGVGKNSNISDGSLAENERAFDLQLGEYATGHVNSKVEFPLTAVKRVDRVAERQPNIEETDKKAGAPSSEATELQANGTKKERLFIPSQKVKCSLLPHFTTAEWGTISLV